MTTKNLIATLISQIASIDAQAEERLTLIKRLAKAGGWADRDAARAALIGPYAAARGVQLTVAQTGPAAGKPAWPEGSDAVKKAFNRLLADMFATSSAEDEVEVPEELLKAAAKLAKLASQYEGSRKLASRALAQAFAA